LRRFRLLRLRRRGTLQGTHGLAGEQVGGNFALSDLARTSIGSPPAHRVLWRAVELTSVWPSGGGSRFPVGMPGELTGFDAV
jgi:hypothetical protein